LVTDSQNTATVSSQYLQTLNVTGVSTIEGTITVTKAIASGSKYATDPAIARARLGGFFFNAGTRTQNSYEGDVGASVCLVKSSDDGSKSIAVNGVIFECLDQACDSIFAIGPIALGTVKLSQTLTVFVQWDLTNHQFIFHNGSKTVSLSYSGVLTDKSPPENDFKTLRVDAVVPSCSSSPCTQAWIEAVFGPIYINR